ncbi:MAG: NAD(P)H-nitrite reductase large subunit [Flavobacterium sp.]|jgi:NAD(P)H-nitrite reductase large subunit
MEHIVIIGNGISGVTTARHIRKMSDKKITIISSETKYFYSRTALMYVFMGHMKMEHTQPYENDFWKKNNIELLFTTVNSVIPEKKELALDNNTSLFFDKLIIATGSKSNKFGWPGQDLNGVVGLYNKQDLDSLEILAKKAKHAVIVGGGLIGIELAEMLISRKIPVTFLVRETNFWGGVLPEDEAKMINRHILEHGIDLRLEANLKEILSDENGNAKSVILENGEEIVCDIVGITVGVSPNVSFLNSSGIRIDKGILVNRFLETNFPFIYAVGDCAQQEEALGNRKPIEAVWYTGRMMGETLAQTICGNPMKYNPGNWFNSAKFFDIEYQTYGWIFNKPKEEETHFYWEHKSGKKAVRINYNSNTQEFIGINTFGIRMKHEFFDSVLNQKQSVNHVIDNLNNACFDPELYTSHTKEIQQSFKNQFATSTL